MPLPGETALITAGVLASQGKMSITLVIATAAGAAIVGDNVGYVLGRKGARRLLQRPGRFEDTRRDLLRRGEAFFERHGSKTVFLGRWLPFLRITAAWLAGAHRMPWPKFLFWNAAGGIGWAITVGLLAFLLGDVATRILQTFGYVVGGAVGIGLIALAVWLIRRRRRAKP